MRLIFYFVSYEYWNLWEFILTQISKKNTENSSREKNDQLHPCSKFGPVRSRLPNKVIKLTSAISMLLSAFVY